MTAPKGTSRGPGSLTLRVTLGREKGGAWVAVCDPGPLTIVDDDFVTTMNRIMEHYRGLRAKLDGGLQLDLRFGPDVDIEASIRKSYVEMFKRGGGAGAKANGAP